jgi:hypothetical protein
MKRFICISLGCIALLFFNMNFAYSWGSTGHKIINLKAVMHLPGTMSALKADSLFYQAHASDPDYRKNYSDTSFFAEDTRHYIDIDIYPNYLNLPHNLDSVTTLYGRTFVKGEGTLPWAIKMVFDSLIAQLSRGDMVYAETTMSDLGHYVADGHQPLHCTANYNPGGLHSRYESQMVNAYQSSITINPDSARYISAPLEYIFDFIYHSNSLVDTVIKSDALAKVVSGWTGGGSAPSTYYDALWQKTGDFTKDQFQRATVALASLWYTAWYDAQVINSVHEVFSLQPRSFALEQNYPNPFNPTTDFRFEIRDLNHVTLKVYDVIGREIATLMDESKQQGSYAVNWNASGFASGTYYYRLQVGNISETRKMILVK